MADARNGGTGVFNHSVAFISEALRYFKARAMLAGEEAKEAGVQYGGAAALVAGALFVAVLGYVLLVLTAVFGLSLFFDSDHAWIAVLGGQPSFISAAPSRCSSSRKSAWERLLLPKPLPKLKKTAYGCAS